MTSTKDRSGEVFAFGQPVLPRTASSNEPRETYVLGAYPSGLHVTWAPPTLPGLARKSIRAMIVDNEPVPFWDGTDADVRFEEWLSAVGWQPEWGEPRPAPPKSNGPSGNWVDKHILRPLGADRDTVCISDALDQARLNAGQARRVEDTYAPVAKALNLPLCTLRPVPGSEGAIVREATHGHLDRLREELRLCQPERIVTLGNAALRVAMLLLVDPQPAPGSRLTGTAYGEPIQAQFEGRRITWLPLVHPRSGKQTPPWPDVHRRWEQSLAERQG